MKEDLKLLGLNDNEIDVYLSLVRTGETSVGSIISDTGLHRQSVYNTLADLERKAMVVKKTKNGVHHFRITDPGVILEKAQERESVAKRLSQQIADELKKTSHEHEINVYDGREKIRKFFLNRNIGMPENSTLYVISNYADKYEEVIGKEFIVNKFSKVNKKKKQNVKIITGESKKEEFKNTISVWDDNVEREIRFIPDDLMPPVATEIWEGGMSYSSFEEEWFVVEIKNKAFYEPYRKYFNALWEIAKN